MGRERTRISINDQVVRNWQAIFLILGGLVLLGQAPASYAQEESPRLKLPRSQLSNTVDAPIFLTFHAAFGGAVDYEIGHIGLGASFIFRPDAAGRFLDFLYGSQTGMVLQAEYMYVTFDRRIFSTDLILRQYLQELPDGVDAVSPFAGVGVGASEISLPKSDGGTFLTGISWLLEAGLEWQFKGKFIGLTKVQWRGYSHDGYDYSYWSVLSGAGFPLPW